MFFCSKSFLKISKLLDLFRKSYGQKVIIFYFQKKECNKSLNNPNCQLNYESVIVKPVLNCNSHSIGGKNKSTYCLPLIATSQLQRRKISVQSFISVYILSFFGKTKLSNRIFNSECCMAEQLSVKPKINIYVYISEAHPWCIFTYFPKYMKLYVNEE